MIPHPFVALAIKSIQYYLDHNAYLPCPENLPDDLKTKSGAFVSIKKNKSLRGCIGTILPVEDNLAREIVRNAVHAAVQDPRFPPVIRKELPDLTFSVDVLSPLEKIHDAIELDCKKYGLLLKTESKQGVLLPDIEGVETVQDQIRICRKKAGLAEDEPAEMFRFQVKRYR
ncbi:MAG: AmmeMemoRadiSam system protein A [Nitrospinae bacterium]|nr:AmmeMemoRadiSam system protein A [Nitrospinota bacterium]